MSSFNLVQIVPSLNSGGVERGTVDVANFLAEKKSKNFIERHLNHLESYKGKDVINVSYEEIINDYSSYVKKMNKAGIAVTPTKPSLHWGVTVCPRKGIIGDYINHMSEELINKITSSILSLAIINPSRICALCSAFLSSKVVLLTTTSCL